jgi:hypothetical protein
MMKFESSDVTFSLPTRYEENQGGQQSGEGLSDVKGDEIQTNWDETVESFDAMNLHDNLLRGIYAYGFENVGD